MSKKITGLPEWANLLLKVLFVMIFPLTVSGTNLLQLINLPTSGLLFTPLQSYSVWMSDFSTLILIINTVLRNFFIGILIAFPGIYYSHKLSRVPVNQSYWKQGLGVAIAIYFLLYGFTILLMMNMYSPEYYWDSSLWTLMQRLGQYTSLVMGVFIILPLVQRQAVIISSPSDLHCYSMSEIESIPKLKLSREKMLSAIFWLVLCFGPMMVQQASMSIDSRGNYYYSLLFIYILSIDAHRHTGSLILNFTGTMNNLSIILLFALLSAFHFAFVRDTYKYLRKTITRKRLLSMVVFSSIFPLIIFLGPGVLMMRYFPLTTIPVPLLQVVGLLLVKYHRPITEQVDCIWKGDTSKMWWEEADREQQREEPVEYTPERPHHHREELIIVPVTYLLISRVRQLNRRLQQRK